MDCDYPSLSLPVTWQCISEETLQCVGPFNSVSKFMNGGGVTYDITGRDM